MLTDSYTVLMCRCHFLSLVTDIMFDVVITQKVTVARFKGMNIEYKICFDLL